MTTRISMITAALAITLCMTACSNSQNLTIPAEDTVNILDAVKTLDVSNETFSEYLNSLDISFDEFMANVNYAGKDLANLKTEIEERYECTYDEYIKTVIAVNNKDIPDDAKYSVFKSDYSLYDAYIPSEELNSEKNRLTDYDISLEIADHSEDAYAFDMIATCSNDFSIYVSTLNQLYDCDSVEFTNMTIFGGHGTVKPDETNNCMDKLFVYDSNTNEILEAFLMPVMTLHNTDENKDITLALSNELGLIFRTEGSDSREKMLKLSALDFQIRSASLNNEEAAIDSNDEN